MLSVRSTAEEAMDAADLDPATYARVLADLGAVNGWTLARRPTLSFLTRAVGHRASFRMLDVGFGHGDMLRAVAHWAAARGIAAELVGIDLNPNSAPAARAATASGLPIEYRTGDYADLAGGGFDVIASSLVAHHMTADQLRAFLRFMDGEAKAGWIVNDLHRHGLAYLGYPVLAALLRWHPIVRADGRLSIARAFRPAEWRAILSGAGISDAMVVRRFPFRLCVEALR